MCIDVTEISLTSADILCIVMLVDGNFLLFFYGDTLVTVLVVQRFDESFFLTISSIINQLRGSANELVLSTIKII